MLRFVHQPYLVELPAVAPVPSMVGLLMVEPLAVVVALVPLMEPEVEAVEVVAMWLHLAPVASLAVAVEVAFHLELAPL